MDLQVNYNGTLISYCSDSDFNNNDIPSSRRILFIMNGDIQEFSFDERDNTIEFYSELDKESLDFISEIKSGFNKFKSNNPSLGNISMSQEYEYEYEPSRHLSIKEFFDFLKTINRDKTINQILNK
jgi:hypothetical protein